MKYKIIKQTYYDDYGKPGEPSYYIKYLKKTIFGYRWKTIKHLEHGFGDISKGTTYFKTIADAKDFVDRCLCGDTPYETWKTEVVVSSACGADFNIEKPKKQILHD